MTSEINDSPSSRHPVLLAVDDFQALYCKICYHNPLFATICSYHPSMPRLIHHLLLWAPAEPIRQVFQAVDRVHQRIEPDTHSWTVQSRWGIVFVWSVESRASHNDLYVPPIYRYGSLTLTLFFYSGPRRDFSSQYTDSSGNPREFVRGLLSTLSVW